MLARPTKGLALAGACATTGSATSGSGCLGDRRLGGSESVESRLLLSFEGLLSQSFWLAIAPKPVDSKLNVLALGGDDVTEPAGIGLRFSGGDATW